MTTRKGTFCVLWHSDHRTHSYYTIIVNSWLNSAVPPEEARRLKIFLLFGYKIHLTNIKKKMKKNEKEYKTIPIS